MVQDRRVRLAAKPLQRNLVYGDPTPANVMYQLHPSTGGSPGGMIWPYTPNITYSQNVDYNPYDLTHTNQSPQAYTKTETLALEIVGDFTAQNSWEARYTLGCIHFLSTVTKSEFGINSDNPGAPPPVLHFSGHGNMLFDRLPVLVRSFNVAFTTDVDYVQANLDEVESLSTLPDLNFGIQRAGNEAWIPSKISISASIIYSPSPQRQVNQFDWQAFRDGSLIKRGGFR